MITYELTLAIRNPALEHGLKRSASMGHRDTTNSQNWMNGKPPYWRHYVGRVGEEIVSLFSGWPLDWDTIGRGDDGTDFPHGIQVKTRETTEKPNLLIPVSQFNRKTCVYYILVWLNEPHAHIIGWITREDFKRLHSVEQMKVPTMVVHHSFLKPMETFPVPMPKFPK